MEILRSDKSRYMLLFFLSSFIFMSFVTSIEVFGLVSPYIQFSTIVNAVLFLLYSTVFITTTNKKTIRVLEKRIMNFSFALLTINVMFLFAYGREVGVGAIAYLFSAYQYIGTNIVLFLPLIFLIFFGIYIYRQKYRKVAYFLFAASIAILLVYFFSGLVFHHYKIDDEIFIQFTSARYFLDGGNPYGISVAQQIFYNSTNGTINSPSITTSNMIMGALNYPSLFLFSFVPFYLLTSPTMQNLINFDLEAQSMVFLLIALFTTALVVEKKFLEKPVYSMILFLTIAMAYLSSITIFLMFALLLLAYFKLESRYSWIFLGLCLSIQEQLWFSVILLIIYSTMNSGFRKGVKNLIGAAGVFLVFNLYFILKGPGAFFGSLFAPASQLLLPSSASPIGYMLVTNYHILLGTYSELFAISMVVLAILFAYLNQKRLVGLFSMIPFMFLSHSIPIYYTFFTGITIVTLFMSQKVGRSGLWGKLQKNRIAVFCALATFCLIATGLVYTSHLSYVKNFNLTANSIGLYFDNLTNKTVYTTTLSYRNLSNNTVYVFVGGISKYNVGFFGILNYSIINKSIACDDYRCKINVNRIVLPDDGIYTLRTYISPSNGEPIYGARLNIYSGNYMYVSGSIFNQSILNLSSGK